jgi:hypothetical protein
MLLITSDFDPAAPTEWADIMWSQSPQSVLVVRHGDDHCSFSLIDQPSTAITKTFLSTGVFPEAMSDNGTSVFTPGMKRGVIPNPYDVATGEGAGDVNCGNLTEAAILP